MRLFPLFASLCLLMEAPVVLALEPNQGDPDFCTHGLSRADRSDLERLRAQERVQRFAPRAVQTVLVDGPSSLTRTPDGDFLDGQPVTYNPNTNTVTRIITPEPPAGTLQKFDGIYLDSEGSPVDPELVEIVDGFPRRKWTP